MFITDLEVRGGHYSNKLYLNTSIFTGKAAEEINKACIEHHNSGWWKSENISDLVNHEIMHAKINNFNSYEKIDRLYDNLHEDNRVKGFCRLVDTYPDEFLNEMYVAVNKGEKIDEKYIKVYDEYVREFLGG